MIEFNYGIIIQKMMSSTTLILLLTLVIIYYYKLQVTKKKCNRKLTLEEYLVNTLNLQYIPLLYILCIVVPIIIILIILFYRFGLDIKVSTLIFLISILIGFFHFTKSVAIIYNNYDKARVAVNYNNTIEIVHRMDTIYKALISNNENSNIDALLNIWTIPLIVTSSAILLTFGYKSIFKSDRELRLKDIVIYIDKISKNMVKKGISLNKKYKEIIDDIRIKQNNSINKEKNLINVVDNIVNEVNTIKGMYKLI
jgi:hypothetical protein